MRALVLATTLALPAFGCDDPPTLADEECPEAGTDLDYATFGAPFMASWCNSCHSGDDTHREGAPTDVTFNSLEEVRDWDTRIFARSALENDSMPPGPDDPSRADRNRLAEWLACGAP